MRALMAAAVLLAQWMPAQKAVAQGTDQSAQTATTVCDFDDGKEISVQYSRADSSKNEPRTGKVWEPGGSPMTLFTQAPVILNNTEIPVGAFSLYAMPNRKDWTLIVNKNVTAGSKYDPAQDLVRAPMEIGNLSQPVKPLQVIFGHMGPKQCTIRLYYGDTGAFAEFAEK